MPSKKNGSKKIFESMPVEPEHAPQESPSEANSLLPESTEEKSDAIASEGETNAEASAAQTSGQESGGASVDDLLEDVRHSLIEEEAEHEKEERPKWWKRIGKASRKNVAQPEPPRVVEEINLPGLDEADTSEPSKLETEQEADPIDELIDLLDHEETTVRKLVVEEKPPEPEKVPDIEELKKQAFQPRASSGQDENLTEVRSIALEGEEEVFVEVQTTAEDPLEERLSAMENALKPYRSYINIGIAFIGLVMAVIAGLLLFNLYKQSVAAPATEAVVSNLPYPVSVSLPGGWTFNLGRGSLTNGRWDPKEAEWLQGTEVCRWVALPWSRQLEAVLRTLNPDDPIDLGMSNNDVLTYKVYSIQQMSPDDMQKLDSNSPCLLIMLAEPDAEKRWVLTAVP